MKAYLVLEDGKVFEGKSLGCEGIAVGEVEFNSAMGNYLEIATDKTNFGKIITMTYPIMGNYGYNDCDLLSDRAYLSGLVVRECCDVPSNYLCKGTFEDFLKTRGVVAIKDIDTRELTKIIRDKGTQKGAVVSGELNIDDVMAKIKAFEIENPLEAVSDKKTYKVKEGTKTVGIFNLGKEKPLVEKCIEYGFGVSVISPFESIEGVKAMSLDGIIVSTGQGSDNVATTVAALASLDVPILAIGKGFEMMALGNGLVIKKLKYGHHSVNHPVKNIKGGRTYITAHNHDYTVDEASIKAGMKVSYISLNDKSIEGIDYSEKVKSVAFEPETLSGEHTTHYIFEEFFKSLGGSK